MGSTATELLKFLPGAAMTTGGAVTGNPALATAGATNLAGATAGLAGGNPTPTAPGMPQPNSGGFGNVGNDVASVAAPLLGVGGAMMANRPQPQQGAAPMSPGRQGAPPLQANQTPVGPAQTVQPMTALAAYQRMLSGTGNS